jgi:diguanylate cyclase (GGDEF)-like protein
MLLSELFDHQASIGDQAKAVVNYKKLTKFGTPTVDQTFKYSQFIEKSDKKTALEGYELALNAFEVGERREESLVAMKRIVLLDPSAANNKRLGLHAEAMGDNKTAAACFLQMSGLEADQGLTWLERGYGLDKSNLPLVLAYGKALIAANQGEKAADVLKQTGSATDGPPEHREAYVQALLLAKKAVEAEPYVWALFEKDPNQVDEVGKLIGLLLDNEASHHKAMELTQKLEGVMSKKNLRREFVNLIKDVIAKHPPGVEFLEFMVGVYNSANRESDYCETLISLFQLYYAAGNFLKAADSLDRAVEVDPYQPGNAKRLEMLRGKIDQNRYSSIQNRMQVAGAATEAAPEEKKDDFDKEPTVLEDFLLQAEIFIQYGMRSKALERIERINKLFPREEEKNEKLSTLYKNAGFVPKYDTPAPAPANPAAAPLSPFGQAPSYGGGGAAPVSAQQMPQLSHDENAVDNFSRVTEITRNIYRQSTVKGVLFATVNDVGRHYNASRCIAGLCSPGKPPSAALEYCAPGMKQSEVQHIVKLLGAVQMLATKVGIVSIDNVMASADLAPIKDSLVALQIQSLLAVPLMDAASDEHVGILLLEQCDKPRQWRQTDAVVLKTIADQMVLAVNNAKLRSLMKNLAVTDEKSGLLKRSSYLDVLLSESKRALAQNSTASLLLFHFGKASQLVKEIGEPAVENMMTQLGQTLTSQIRQNDVAVRYELTTIALILPDTTDKNAFFVIDKMRKVLSGFKIQGTDRPLEITVGIAEAVMNAQYDPIDIVTEVINRAESALESAKAEGPNSAKSVAPQAPVAAVA